MIKFLMFLVFTVFFSTAALAGSSINCIAVKGKHANDSLQLKSIRLESGSDYFEFMDADLHINFFGKEESFTALSRSVSGNSSKIDFQAVENPDVKALLLLDKPFGQVKKKVKGLLVVTGLNIDFFFFGARSLVYNVSCKL